MALGLSVLLVGLVAIGLTVARPWHLEGRSMAPQIPDGSLLVVDVLGPQVSGYRRGDIVVLKTPPSAPETPYSHLVKRVVAVPGERVRVAGPDVYVNGQLLAEPYLAQAAFAGSAAPQSREIVIPPGEVFVMGDHRDDSLDSTSFGSVPVSSLEGRVWLILDDRGIELPAPSPQPAVVAAS